MINTTSGSSICYTWNERHRCQDVRKHNHSQWTERPLVTDNESTTVKEISLGHENMICTSGSCYIFQRSLTARSILREYMKPPVKLVSSECCFIV